MFNKKIYKIIVILLCLMFILPGCSKPNSETSNNDKTTTTQAPQVKKKPTIDALKAEFAGKGFNVGDNKPVAYQMINATDGAKFTLNNQIIEVYLYDEDVLTPEGKKSLEEAKKGAINMSGVTVKVQYINGFVLANVDKHKEKDKIIETVKNFEY